jgi:hypothetical protein
VNFGLNSPESLSGIETKIRLNLRDTAMPIRVNLRLELLLNKRSPLAPLFKGGTRN